MKRKKTLVVDIDNSILAPFRRKAKAYVDALSSIDRVLDGSVISKLRTEAKKSYGFAPMKRYANGIIISMTFDRFLSDDYLVMEGDIMDEPVRGSVDFLNDAIEKGCKIRYLTGRHGQKEGKTGMVRGTLISLERLGFPVPSINEDDGDVHITFKDKRMRNDVEFKLDEIKKIKENEDIIAIIDDRLPILKSLKKNFKNIPLIAPLIYPDLNEVDYGCVPSSQEKIMENIDTTVKGGIECIRDFTRTEIEQGCKIMVNNRKIS